MTAVGIASPIAHGQAMISTASAAANACTVGAVIPTMWPMPIQAKKVSTAMPITTGTNTPLIWSARCWMGARDPCASRMSRTT